MFPKKGGLCSWLGQAWASFFLWGDFFSSFYIKLRASQFVPVDPSFCPRPSAAKDRMTLAYQKKIFQNVLQIK